MLGFTILVRAGNSKVENLVFEGAGIRGIAYAGVIAELEQQSLMQHVEKVGGTSAGAIVATLLALDYNSNEIAEIITSTKMQKFNDGKYMFVGGMHRMANRYGWYQGVRFNNWIGNLIKSKTGNADITLKELKEYGCKELHLTATCLNKQKMIVLSHKSYPEMKVRDAVRISMSIPLYFEAVFVDAKGKTYRKPDKTKKLDIMVDGGIIGNFPIHIFDDPSKVDTCTNLPYPNPNTLGIRIDDADQIIQDQKRPDLVDQDIDNLRDYVSAFYVLVLENLNRHNLTEEDWDRTVSVSSAGIGPRIKKLSKEQKELLVESGRTSIATYFSNQGSSQ